jgi:integrase
MKAVEALRCKINNGSLRRTSFSFGSLIERYLREELPERFSTRVSYASLLKCRIRPRWGDASLEEIKPMDVEHWLRSLPGAPKTKVNIRNLMHLLFECARRWDLIDRNPIELVRQGGQRRQTPRRLTVEELRRLLAELENPCRLMVILAASLGLRIGEILGLQWGDIDLLGGTLKVQRAVYQYHVGPAKTAYSEATLPLAPEILQALQGWLGQAVYRSATDYVFASKRGGLVGADKIRTEVLQPAGLRAGVGKIGWHTLRHSFATALDVAGARAKVAQELMRHANYSTTMDIYTGALERDKKETASRVAQALLAPKN